MEERTIRRAGDAHVAVQEADAGPDDARCFADEVGIDFPSLCSAIDRMRRSFVAEDGPSPLGTVVRLSRREARHGTTVPLEVPVRTTCRACGGRGESWAEPCGSCGGSGVVLRRQPLQVTLPAGVLDGTRLHFIVNPRHHLPTPIELRVVVHA